MIAKEFQIFLGSANEVVAAFCASVRREIEKHGFHVIEEQSSTIDDWFDMSVFYWKLDREGTVYVLKCSRDFGSFNLWTDHTHYFPGQLVFFELIDLSNLPEIIEEWERNNPRIVEK